MKRLLTALILSCAQLIAVAQTTAASTYEKALDLVHAYNGSGPELEQAMHMAGQLVTSAPNSGYSQVLYAEALSTWHLEEDGTPVDVRNQVIQLADQALKLNPKFAQAHVAKGRAQLRASMYDAANASIDAALAVYPNLSGALFLRADIFRRTGAIADADTWYRKFIASTPSKSRKANGYGWLAIMYKHAAWEDEKNRAQYTAKAKEAIQTELSLAPDGAWRNVNYAIFLNDYAADFDGAERYAQKALSKMEFPMARYHLAAARYQKLATTAPAPSPAMLQTEIRKIEKSTGISLDDALKFDAFSSVVTDRLAKLQLSLMKK